MDIILRALQRKYTRDFADLNTAQQYINVLERTLGGEQLDPNPLDEILFDLLLAHLESNEGVDSFTNNATIQLIRLLFNEEAVSKYESIINGNEGRYWLENINILDA